MATAPRASAPVVASGAAPARSALGRFVDALGVAAFVLVWCLAAAALATGLSPLEGVWLACLALPTGHLLADLFSGLLHWFADEFFEEDTPLLGPALIFGFRDHHRNPGDILEHGLFEVSGYNALATVPVLASLLLWPPTTLASSVLHGVVLATALSVALTNQFHRFAHADRVPRSVAWLQRKGLILSADGHARHHRGGTRAYCVTSGWCNPTLDAMGLLPALSRRVHALTQRWGMRRRVLP